MENLNLLALFLMVLAVILAIISNILFGKRRFSFLLPLFSFVILIFCISVFIKRDIFHLVTVLLVFASVIIAVISVMDYLLSDDEIHNDISLELNDYKIFSLAYYLLMILNIVILFLSVDFNNLF